MTAMKKQTLALMWVGACICLSSLSVQAQKIMPFGDSVTSRGSDPESSYRYWLWQDLQNAGFTGVTFIGQQSGVTGGGPPAHTDFDQSFEGGESLTSADALSMAPAAANCQGGPDIVRRDF